MSSFGIGTNVSALESRSPKGRQIDIACKTWFTASGTALPLSFKFVGEDGMIQRVGDVSVDYCEDKNYCGIPSKEYGCRAIIGGIMHEFKLIFYMEECRWAMVLA